MARRARFLTAALLPLAVVAVAVSALGAEGPRTRVVLLVVREDGVWRVGAEDGRAARVPGTRGAVAAGWAPNGRELAFERDGAIFGANADGTGLRTLMAGSDPTWSPDGRNLAVVRAGRVVVVRRNGRAARALTTGPADGRPTWSPDGRRIAFVRDRTISVVGVSGGAVTALARGADPDWSPDGRRIAFAHEAGGIATVAADGSDLRLLTLDGGAAALPLLATIFASSKLALLAAALAYLAAGLVMRLRPGGRAAAAG